MSGASGASGMTADDHGEATPAQRTPGRRHEDIELRNQIQQLMRNRLARRIGLTLASVAFATASYWLGTARDEWSRIPTRDWTAQVNEAVANANVTRAKLSELNVRVDNLQQAIETNSLQDEKRQQEVLTEIRGLRTDLKQAVRDAASAAAEAVRRP